MLENAAHLLEPVTVAGVGLSIALDLQLIVMLVEACCARVFAAGDKQH